MLLSINRFTGDGVTTQWEINFSGGYIDQAHVKAFSTDPLTDVDTPRTLTFTGPNTVEITPAVPNTHILEIYRDTPKEAPLVDYTDGAIVNARNLDRTAQQSVFVAAETTDRLIETSELSVQASEDSAAALALATTANDNVQQALTDSAEALANVSGAIAAADAATVAANAANLAATTATQAVIDVTATADSALAIATDAEAVATGIAATANQALLDSAEALSTANGIAATADAALIAANAATATANSAESLATTAASDAASAVAALAFKVDKDSDTGAASMPVGSTAQRPAGASGKFRYNSTVGQFEGHNGSAWHRHYTQGNILGTVSQSGGVPTGAIIERGSNANGEYIRFADGTQICTMRIAVTDQAINTAYSSLFQGTRTWIFPATFSTTDGLSVTCGSFKWGSSAAWSGVGNASTATEAVLRGWDTVSRTTGTTTDISATAVGRWF